MSPGTATSTRNALFFVFVYNYNVWSSNYAAVVLGLVFFDLSLDLGFGRPTYDLWSFLNNAKTRESLESTNCPAAVIRAFDERKMDTNNQSCK